MAVAEADVVVVGGRAYAGRANGSGLSSVKLRRPVSLFRSISNCFMAFFIPFCLEASLWASTGFNSSAFLWIKSSQLRLVTRLLRFFDYSSFSFGVYYCCYMASCCCASSIHLMARGLVGTAPSSDWFGGGMGPICEFMKVLRRRSSSQA